QVPARWQRPMNPRRVLTPLRFGKGIVLDEEGNPRYIWGERVLGKNGSYVRRNDRWEPIRIWDEGEPERIPLGLDERNNRVFIAASDQGEPHRIEAVDIASGERTLLLPSRAVEPVGLLMGEDGPIAAAYHDGKVDYVFVDQESTLAKVYAGLEAAFLARLVRSAGGRDDLGLFLVRVFGDRIAGVYYLCDASPGRARFLLAKRSWIKPGAMAATRP